MRLAISNVGPIKVGGPIADAYLGYSQTEQSDAHNLMLVYMHRRRDWQA